MSDNLIGDADKNADILSELEAAARLAQGPPISLYDYETRNKDKTSVWSCGVARSEDALISLYDYETENNCKTRPQSSGCRCSSEVHFRNSYHYTITKHETKIKLATGPAHAPEDPQGPGRVVSLFSATCKYKLQVHAPPACTRGFKYWFQIFNSPIF